MDPSSIQDAHNRYQDSLLAAFESHLREMVMRAQARVLAKLQRQLSITDGRIDQTPANLRALRNVNNLFMREMDEAGFDRLLNAFVGEFNGQIQFLDDALKYLSDQMQSPLFEKIRLTGDDTAVLAALQANTVSALETAVELSAGAAMTRGMFTVGGLKFGDLVDTLTQKFEVGIGQASSVAETAQTVFYRTAQDRVYQKIQAGQKEELRYRFTGPRDKLNRPWCRKMLDADKSYTRAEIDKMNNGQTGPGTVWTMAGGWRCRHLFDVDTTALEAQMKAAA